MLALPPPISERAHLIAAARRRRISSTTIADAMGITRQAVLSHVFRYERYHGPIPIPVLRINKRQKPSMQITRCPSCGGSVYRNANGRVWIYCSQACFAKSIRLLTRKEVIWSIEQRVLHGNTWTGIAKVLKTDMQTVQNNIWILLVTDDRLTKEIVHKIWKPAASLMNFEGKWNWLIRRNGIEPT